MIEWIGLTLIGGALLLTLKQSLSSQQMQGLRARFSLKGRKETRTIDQASGKVSDMIREKLSPIRFKRLGERLERAGYPSTSYPQFMGQQISHGFFGAFGGILLFLFADTPLYIVGVLAFTGFLLPGMRLNARIRSRQAEIRLQLPYYLDLLTLALEAGLDLVAAVEEIVTRDKENALRFELLLTLKSVRMGTTRTKAFSDLAGRTGVEALNLFANSIQQSEELGSSLGGLLRIQAESLRREIFRDAEERAQKAPVKMLLPLIFCLFPVVMLIMFVPLGLRVMGLY